MLRNPGRVRSLAHIHGETISQKFLLMRGNIRERDTHPDAGPVPVGVFELRLLIPNFDETIPRASSLFQISFSVIIQKITRQNIKLSGASRLWQRLGSSLEMLDVAWTRICCNFLLDILIEFRMTPFSKIFLRSMVLVLLLWQKLAVPQRQVSQHLVGLVGEFCWERWSGSPTSPRSLEQ